MRVNSSCLSPERQDNDLPKVQDIQWQVSVDDWAWSYLFQLLTMNKETTREETDMGYTWEQVSPEGKRVAKKLASDLGCTEIEAYQLVVQKMFP